MRGSELFILYIVVTKRSKAQKANPTLQPVDFFRGNSELVADSLSRSDINWDTFLSQASRQSVLPALANQSKLLDTVSLLPAEISHFLTTAETLNAERNRQILSEAIY